MSAPDRDAERQRADNIIWNSAGDYSFRSEVRAYDSEGRAELYFNYIIGAAHRCYDFSRLQECFDALDRRAGRELFLDLMWLGLENGAYGRDLPERPALEPLRFAYARGFLQRRSRREEDAAAMDASASDYILEQVRAGHFRRALGLQDGLSGMALMLLDDVEFPPELDTEAVIERMNGILQRYFTSGLLLSHSFKKRGSRDPFFLKFAHNSFADETMGLEFDLDESRKNAALGRLIKLKGMGPEARRKYVLGRYGDSCLTGEETARREKELCTGIHTGCRLLYTRGAHSAPAKRFSEEERHRASAARQRELNLLAWRRGIERGRCAVAQLTNLIKNSLLLSWETPPARTASGELLPGAAWRASLLGDDRVFSRRLRDDQEGLSVDICLDGSASQADRQEEIAVQAYIIAESFTRCRVPVRVFSFRSDLEYTIIETYRDYDEVRGNGAIFGYYASGCNRDGLALRAAMDMISRGSAGQKILIVLSDGLPNDTQGVRTGGAVTDYLGEGAENDAALEVRRGRRMGLSVLCVYTGRDSTVPRAKRIYGRELAYIRSQSRFASAVGALIRDELKNR